MIETSAPGKLLICGEYAVLHGAPAVVMAVDRRAVVRISPSTNSSCTLSTPGLVKGNWRFVPDDDDGIRWLDDAPTSVRAIPDAVISRTRIDSPMDIDIDSSEFMDRATGTKLGLGSSAAATVALVHALSSTDVAATWSTARDAHQSIQGGSGADIAASCFGGLLVYQRDTADLPEQLEWPEGLVFRAFYSGVPASTRAAIERSEAGGIDAGDWQKLTDAAAEAVNGWRSGQASHALDAVRLYRDALGEFDRAGSIGIFSAGHDEAVNLGESLGVAYKPSGAGGGDCGIAFATNAGELDAFSEAVTSQGFVPLDIQRDNRGI